MPKRDGRGPIGRKAMSGRGLGFGNGANSMGKADGTRLGRGQGYGKGCDCPKYLGKCYQTNESGLDQMK